MVSLYKKELQKIEELLCEYLKDVDDDDIHGRYEVHRVAFNELMRMVKVYNPILGSIKEEYESLIGHVLKNQQYARMMEEELQKACSYPVTIVNYERRCSELRKQLHQLRRDKEHELERIRDVQLKCQSVRRVMDTASNEDQKPTKMKREIRRLPGLTLSSLTDLATMQSMYEQLVTQKLHMQRSMSTKYVDKDEQIQLEYQLKKQISNHDNARQEVRNLIRCKFLMQAALVKVRSLDTCRTSRQNVGETILKSLMDSARSMEKMSNKCDEDTVEEEINRFFPESTAPIGSMKESDYIVRCIRHFEKLFQDEKYKEAADLAVIVPRGVLRNYATMLKFKEIGGVHLLYYCQQLISSMTCGRLDTDMSYECVDSALKEGKIDSIKLWISKNRLQSSELIADNLACSADLMPDHKTICLDLAAAIYWDLLRNLANGRKNETANESQRNPKNSWTTSRRKYFDSILECRIKSGRIEEAVDMLTKEGSTPVSARSVEIMYNEEDLLLLVTYYPDIDLIQGLVNKGLVSLASVFNVLLESQSYGIFANLLISTVLETKDVSAVTDQLCAGVTNGVSTDAWEWMLNFVGESSEKIIIEVAASYLVRISLERSCKALIGLEYDS